MTQASHTALAHLHMHAATHVEVSSMASMSVSFVVSILSSGKPRGTCVATLGGFSLCFCATSAQRAVVGERPLGGGLEPSGVGGGDVDKI